jgi:serine/threonine-protein kinase
MFSPGDLIAGRFRVIRLIGSGGIGEVYEVYDERLSIPVALKTIRADVIADKGVYDRFKEQVIVRNVPHRNICRIYDLVEHVQDDQVIPCITMELLDTDLQKELQRRGRPLPLPEALALIRQIAEGLQALHDHHIVHRDLKPSNILLEDCDDGSRRVALTDFELSALVKERPIGQTRSTGQTTLPRDQPGTPYFQAPELLRGISGKKASDIYALGLVIDEMVTASPAFTAKTLPLLYYQKFHERPARPSKRANGLPARWERTILQCLDDDPGRRFSSSIEVLRSLEDAAPVIGVFVKRALLYVTLLLLFTVGVLSGAYHFGKPPRLSIAVFDISTWASEPGFLYLSKGITAELIRRLSQSDDVQVYPVRETGNNRRGSPNLPEASLSLEGDLRHSDQRVRLTLRILDPGGKVVWHDNFEREVGDPLALESDVAEKVSRALAVQLRRGSPQMQFQQTFLFQMAFSIRQWITPLMAQLPRPATNHSAALAAYFRGRALADRRSLKEIQAAIREYQLAIELDGKFALAYSALAEAHNALLDHRSESEEELITKAREYAEKAVSLDPRLPEARASQAVLLQQAWEWERADEEYRAALAIHPRFARGYQWYSGLLLQRGRVDQALENARTATILDPLGFAAHSNYGLCLFYADKPLEAARYLEWVLANTKFHNAHSVLGQVYAYLSGKTTGSEAQVYEQKAVRQAELIYEFEVKANDPGTFSNLVYALTYAYRKKPDRAKPWIERLERNDRFSPAFVARAYAALGDRERALQLLEEAVARRHREVMNLTASPFFAGLRNEARFRALVRTMRLTG